jgi:hypothetical protein
MVACSDEAFRSAHDTSLILAAATCVLANTPAAVAQDADKVKAD